MEDMADNKQITNPADDDTPAYAVFYSLNNAGYVMIDERIHACVPVRNLAKAYYTKADANGVAQGQNELSRYDLDKLKPIRIKFLTQKEFDDSIGRAQEMAKLMANVPVKTDNGNVDTNKKVHSFASEKACTAMSHISSERKSRFSYRDEGYYNEYPAYYEDNDYPDFTYPDSYYRGRKITTATKAPMRGSKKCDIPLRDMMENPRALYRAMHVDIDDDDVVGLPVSFENDLPDISMKEYASLDDFEVLLPILNETIVNISKTRSGWLADAYMQNGLDITTDYMIDLDYSLMSEALKDWERRNDHRVIMYVEAFDPTVIDFKKNIKNLVTNGICSEDGVIDMVRYAIYNYVRCILVYDEYLSVGCENCEEDYFTGDPKDYVISNVKDHVDNDAKDQKTKKDQQAKYDNAGYYVNTENEDMYCFDRYTCNCILDALRTRSDCCVSVEDEHLHIVITDLSGKGKDVYDLPRYTEAECIGRNKYLISETKMREIADNLNNDYRLSSVYRDGQLKAYAFVSVYKDEDDLEYVFYAAKLADKETWMKDEDQNHSKLMYMKQKDAVSHTDIVAADDENWSNTIIINDMNDCGVKYMIHKPETLFGIAECIANGFDYVITDASDSKLVKVTSQNGNASMHYFHEYDHNAKDNSFILSGNTLQSFLYSIRCGYEVNSYAISDDQMRIEMTAVHSENPKQIFILSSTSYIRRLATGTNNRTYHVSINDLNDLNRIEYLNAVCDISEEPDGLKLSIREDDKPAKTCMFHAKSRDDSNTVIISSDLIYMLKDAIESSHCAYVWVRDCLLEHNDCVDIIIEDKNSRATKTICLHRG